MPPINDTGGSLIVGPDVHGDVFEVAPGEDYELPQPPRTVSEEEAEAPAEPETPALPSGDSGSVPAQPPKTPTPDQGQQPPAQPDDTKGASA